MDSVQDSAAAINVNVANLLGVYSQATGDEVRRGMVWYRQSSGEVARIFPELSRSAAIGVVAALSPQKPWARNIALAVKLRDTGHCAAVTNAKDKARQILAGRMPHAVLKGNKVRAFYRCLLDQSTDDVCVDGHAYSAWKGVRIKTSQVKTIPKRIYKAVAEDYRTAAAIVGIKPHQMQAIVWVTWRRLHQVRKERDHNGTVH